MISELGKTKYKCGWCNKNYEFKHYKTKKLETEITHPRMNKCPHCKKLNKR